jgi:D-sedoheptulose 7-phosphate isomerase
MNDGSAVRRPLQELVDLLREVAESRAGEIEAAAAEISRVLRAGGKLLFCGNGGSAADAQHLAAEYVVRFSGDRRALPAIALTTDTSVLTAAANDLGFQQVFSRQVEALGAEGDCLILHSTSGESENLLRAAETARKRGMRTLAFLAKGGGRLSGMVHRAVVIPTASTPRAQEVHLALGHIICELVERALEEGSP